MGGTFPPVLHSSFKPNTLPIPSLKTLNLNPKPSTHTQNEQDLAADPGLVAHKRALVAGAARTLKASQMAVFDEASGAFALSLLLTPSPPLRACWRRSNQGRGGPPHAPPLLSVYLPSPPTLQPPIPPLQSVHIHPGNLYVTELGRVASHFYIKHQSMVTFNETMRPHMGEAALLAMAARCDEFDSMMARPSLPLPLSRALEGAPRLLYGCFLGVRGGGSLPTSKPLQPPPSRLKPPTNRCARTS